MPDATFEPNEIAPFVRYLQEIDLLLCDLPHQRRTEIEQELVTHLEDAARERKVSPDDYTVQQEVIADLGSSFEMGVALYQANTSKLLTTKRGIDIFVSLLLLVVASPLLLISAILVKLDSYGPVFYRDARQGKHGRPIMIYKLRTMSPTNMTEQPLRVTRVGRILRKTFVDEIPQLLNVLKGDLSLVGLCPISQNYGELDNSLRCHLQAVKPGFCTPGHVKYGFVRVGMERQIVEDAQYVSRRSLRYDFLVMQKLVAGIVRDQRYKK